jgi:hypothetical protein
MAGLRRKHVVMMNVAVPQQFCPHRNLGWHGMMGTHEAVAADVQLAAAAQRHLAIQFNREFSKGFVRNP